MATGVYSNDDTEIHTRMCPACGFKGALRRATFKDSDWWRKSGITRKEADSISVTDVFHQNICVACNFQWVPMEEHLTTSRLRAYLITRVIDVLEQSSSQNIDQVVTGLCVIFNTQVNVANVKDDDYIRWETLTDIVDIIKVATGEELLTFFHYMNGNCPEPESLPPVINNETSRKVETEKVLQDD
jgi:hypothetical protein